LLDGLEKRSLRSVLKIVSRERKGTEAKVRRLDAVRNHGRVLDAAREVFADRGIDVPVDAVAKRAGVGVGTVFRHYPTKDALLAAVIERSFEELADAAESAAQEKDVDAAFAGFVRHVASVMTQNRALVGMARARVADRRRYQPEEARLFRAVDRLVHAAQKVGAVRPGITGEDVAALLSGIGDAEFRVVTGTSRAGGAERYVSVVLDGLRPPPQEARAARSRKRRRSTAGF
jgi:AcrR family transcriptional regulator